MAAFANAPDHRGTDLVGIAVGIGVRISCRDEVPTDDMEAILASPRSTEPPARVALGRTGRAGLGAGFAGIFSRRMPAVATPPEPLPVAAAPRPRRAPTKSPAGRFVYAGVDDFTRSAASRLAAALGHTVADLVVMGVPLVKPSHDADLSGDHSAPPITGVRRANGLSDLQIRVSPAQHAWLTKEASKRSGVSMRLFAGRALAAYIDTHTELLAKLGLPRADHASPMRARLHQ